MHCLMLSSFTPLLTLTHLSLVRLNVSRENLFPPPRVYKTHPGSTGRSWLAAAALARPQMVLSRELK